MAKYGSNSVVDEFDTAGGALTDMTQYTLEINGVEIEAVMEESHSFGKAWFESLASGMRKVADIVKSGFYDDTATTGPDAMYNAVASGPSVATRTEKVTYGSTKTTAVESFIQKYGRKLARAKLHMYEVTLKPTGQVTET